MDEKDLNDELKEKSIPENENQPVDQSENAEVIDQTTEEKDDSGEWSFDGQVHTDLDDLDLSYSGKEIVLEDVEANSFKQDDVITIDKSKIRKVMKIVGISIVALIVALALAFGVMFSFFKANPLEINTPVNTALSVDGKSVSVGEYNYYYAMMTSSDKMQQYVQYMGLDTSKSYEEQYYNEGSKQTWADYFEQSAIDQIKYITALSEKAKDKKIKLTEEQEKSIQTELDTIKSDAVTAGMSTSQYLAKNYGANIGTKTIKSIMTRSFLAQNYYQQEQASKQYTSDEVNKYYDEHSENFITTSFRYLPFEFAEDDETAKAEAKAKAEAFLNDVTSEENFLTAATGYVTESYATYLNDQYTKIAGVAKTDTNIPSNIREWLYTDGVKENDKNVFLDEEQGCYYAVLAIGTPGKNEEKLYSVRHILTNVKSGTGESDAETTDSTATTEAVGPTEQQWADCKVATEKILAEFNKTDKSQLAFAELAEKYSEDTASTTAGTSGLYGGLYSQVPAGKMVPEFESWATDASRKYGDADIVKTEKGYHVMFFITNQETWKYSVEGKIFEDNNKEFIASIDSKKKSGFKKCTAVKAETGKENLTETTTAKK